MELPFGEVQTFVSDLGRAREFYAGVLGLDLVAGSGEWLVFNVSGNQLILIIMGGASRGQPRAAYGEECATVLCLEPIASSCASRDRGDFCSWRDHAELKRREVRFFSGINRVPQGCHVAFQDPDGNLLELIQKSDA